MQDGTISRSQNAVYVMPHDWASIAQFLAPLLDRVDDAAPDVQLVVITSDAELAAAVTAAAAKITDGRKIKLLAATSAARAARLLRLGMPHVLAGTADAILELLRGAAVKLDTVKSVCIAWADELVMGGSSAAGKAATSLETVMAELPKEAGRTVVTAELSPPVEELLERYARRARRVVPTASEMDQPMNVDFVTVSSQSRLGTLRRVLDETNPGSAFVFVRDRDTEPEVGDLLRSLGYGGEGAPVRMGLVASPDTELAVLFDLPASREELREAAGAASRTIALVQPRQVSSLRALAGGVVRPFTLPESGQRARDQDARTREEIRRVLVEGEFGRELIALEPLLDEYDGIEIAAAVLQLVEQERVARATAASAAVAAGTAGGGAGRRESAHPSTGMTRLFVSVGSRDNARPGDLVGAIANEGGINSSDVGRIDMRESYSIVEVAPAVADTVIERVNGVVIRGRRAVVRREEARGRGSEGPRGRGSEGPRVGGSERRFAAKSGPGRGGAARGGPGRGGPERGEPGRRGPGRGDQGSRDQGGRKGGGPGPRRGDRE